MYVHARSMSTTRKTMLAQLQTARINNMRLIMECPALRNRDKTRKRAIAKALHLEGHSDFAPVDLAYYQHFLCFLLKNIAFWEVPPGKYKYKIAYLMLTRGLANVDKGRGATPLVNTK